MKKKPLKPIAKSRRYVIDVLIRAFIGDNEHGVGFYLREPEESLQSLPGEVRLDFLSESQ